MKVKITIKGKAGQAGTLAEALDGFLKDELKVRAKYPEKTQYEIPCGTADILSYSERLAPC